MPTRFYLYPFKTGDILRLKKPHPCGGYLWQVERVGADIGMKCLQCGRFQTLARRKLEKAVKSVVKRDESGAVKGEADNE